MAALAAKDEAEDLASQASEGKVSVPEKITEQSVANGTDQTVEETERLSPNALRQLVEGELGGQSGIGAIYCEKSMESVTNRLDELGMVAGFGELQVGCVDKGEGTHTFLIPGKPPTLLETESHSPVDKILKVLSKGR